MSLLTDAMSATKKDIGKVQIELTTNQKAFNYSELDDKAGLYQGLESFFEAGNAQLDNTLFIGPDFSILKKAITTIRENAEKFATIADQGRNKTLENFNFQQFAQSTLDQVRDLLNIKTPNRFLCGGSVSDQKPVDLTLLPNPATYHLDDTDDAAMPSYYKGDSEQQHITLSGQKIDYAFTANELGPQRLIRALHIMATADPNDVNYDVKIEESARVARLALTDIRNIESRLGYATGTFQNAKTKLVEESNSYQSQMIEINGIDRNEIAVKLVMLTQLQNAQTAVVHQSLKSTDEAINRFLGG